MIYRGSVLVWGENSNRSPAKFFFSQSSSAIAIFTRIDNSNITALLLRPPFSLDICIQSPMTRDMLLISRLNRNLGGSLKIL